MSMFTCRIAAVALISATVASCDKPAPTPSVARPVRTTAVERPAEGETISLTGQVRAKDRVNLAFQLDGRMIARPINVGDVLTAGLTHRISRMRCNRREPTLRRPRRR